MSGPHFYGFAPLCSCEPTRIHPATSADAELLAAVAERTFRSSFTGDNSGEDVAALSAETLDLRRIREEAMARVSGG